MAFSTVQLAAALALAPTVLAHGHGESHIGEGQTISAEPLVRMDIIPVGPSIGADPTSRNDWPISDIVD